MAMSHGDCIGGGVGQKRSPRSSIFPPNDPSLSKLHLRMISPHCNGAEAQRDTIGQTERNSVRFGKQKAQATCSGEQKWCFHDYGKNQHHGLSALLQLVFHIYKENLNKPIKLHISRMHNLTAIEHSKQINWKTLNKSKYLNKYIQSKFNYTQSRRVPLFDCD